MHIQHLNGPTCFERLRLVPNGYSSPLFLRGKGPESHASPCPSSKQMSQFVDFVLEQYDLTHINRVGGRVVVLDRAPYIAHPRSSGKDTPRSLKNLAILAHQLPAQVKNASLLNAQVHTLVNLTMQEQIQIIREASIVIGNHGAGLTHLIWLHKGAHVIEMSCFKSKTYPFFGPLSKWKPGIYHHCLPLAEGIISDDYWIKKCCVSSR